jgi:hypothetical protein
MFKAYKDASQQYLNIGSKRFGLKIEPCYDGARRFGLTLMLYYSLDGQKLTRHYGWLPIPFIKLA